MSALDRDGRSREIEAEGLLAVCIQHEIDHLDGRLFVDYLSRPQTATNPEEGGEGPAVRVRTSG